MVLAVACLGAVIPAEAVEVLDKETAEAMLQEVSAERRAFRTAALAVKDGVPALVLVLVCQLLIGVGIFVQLNAIRRQGRPMAGSQPDKDAAIASTAPNT